MKKEQQEEKEDYHKYILNRKEWIICIGQGMGIILTVAWLFYHSLWAMIPLSGFLYFWKQKTSKKLAKEQRRELAVQFRDLILAVSSGLQAGYSMENAFLEAGKEVSDLYGAESLIGKEAKYILLGIRNNIPLEKLLLDLGKRSDQEDVENFAEIFSIAKRSGGNFREIIRKSAEVTGEKIAVQREIQTMLSSRKYEQKIMNTIPFLIIAYLQLTSRGYFDMLYGNLPGVLIMSGALTVYLAAWYLSDRMVEIEV